MQHTTFGAIGESVLPRKHVDQDGTKVIADHNTLSKARQKSSKHCQEPYIDFDIDFH